MTSTPDAQEEHDGPRAEPFGSPAAAAERAPRAAPQTAVRGAPLSPRRKPERGKPGARPPARRRRRPVHLHRPPYSVEARCSGIHHTDGDGAPSRNGQGQGQGMQPQRPHWQDEGRSPRGPAGTGSALPTQQHRQLRHALSRVRSSPPPRADHRERPTTHASRRSRRPTASRGRRRVPAAKQAATKAPVPTAGSIAESETTTVEAPTARQTAVSGVPASTDTAGKQRRPKLTRSLRESRRRRRPDRPARNACGCTGGPVVGDEDGVRAGHRAGHRHGRRRHPCLGVLGAAGVWTPSTSSVATCSTTTPTRSTSVSSRVRPHHRSDDPHRGHRRRSHHRARDRRRVPLQTRRAAGRGFEVTLAEDD